MVSRQQVQYINSEVVLSTLATATAVTTATIIDPSREQGSLVKELRLAVSYKGKTAGESPLIVGLCELSLSVTEIKEAIEADPQLLRDVPASEQGNRRVFPIWQLDTLNTSNSEVKRMSDVKWPWRRMEEGMGIKVFVFNNSGSTLTTGCTVVVFGAAITEWLHD